MSGFFGIFNRNGELVENDIANSMFHMMSSWSPDECKVSVNSNIVLGHAMFWNTPESKYEHLPLEKDNYILTMDARLDNREELLAQLELPQRPLSEIGDSEFILAAYKKWGAKCPEYLLGDFAFVVWDKQKQQIFCARDHVGVKPFYYYLDENYFIFGNDIKTLTTHPQIIKIINDKAVGIFLTVGELWHPEITFFKSIKKLPAARNMIVTANNMLQDTYWKAEDSPIIKLNSIDEYSKKLRSLLHQSVEARARSIYPVTSHLSGGLDSSTIAVISARFLEKLGKKLLAFNWVHSPKKDDVYEHFEWFYSKDISTRENIEHHYIEIDEKAIFNIWKNLDLTSGDTVDLWYEFIVREKVKDFNSRVVLSGWGGDELISAAGKTLIMDKVSRGNLFKAIKMIMEETSVADKPLKKFLKLIYKDVFLNVYDAVSNSLNEKKIDQKNLKYCYSDFKNYIIKKDIGVRSKLPSFRLKDRQLYLYYQGHIQNRLESWSASGTVTGIEYRYPLLDKRIVEFALGVPSEVYRKNGYLRYLIRHATSGILTEEIRWGHTKYEIERVKKLYDLELKVIMMLMDDLQNHDLSLDKNKYINMERLFKDKELLKKISAKDFSHENFDIIQRVLRSIQILKILEEREKK